MAYRAPGMLAAIEFLQSRREKASAFSEIEAAARAAGHPTNRAALNYMAISGDVASVQIDGLEYFVASAFKDVAEREVPFPMSADVAEVYQAFGAIGQRLPATMLRTRGISPLGVGDGVSSQ